MRQFLIYSSLFWCVTDETTVVESAFGPPYRAAGAECELGALLAGCQQVNPNAARWSDQAIGIARSSSLTVRERGWRPSTMASTISGAR
jgi:hypothetical protein